jgi:hypothetical protein
MSKQAIHERIICDASPVEWMQAEAADEGKPKKFSTTAYTGGMVRISGWGNVVFDLAGIAPYAESVPILLHHDPRLIAGHTESINIRGTTIKLAGVISGVGPAAAEVLGNAKNGFPWKASIGVDPIPGKVEWVAEGASAKANGRTFKGPCAIIRGGHLMETSLLPIPADSRSSVSIAAGAASRKEFQMEPKFVEWLQAKGFDAEALSEQQQASLKAAYDQENKPAEKPAETPPANAGHSPDDAVEKEIARLRASQAAETKRIADIRKLCAGGHAELEAKAIESGLGPTDVELEILRAGRPVGPAIHAGGQSVDAKVLEAAMLMAVMHPEQAMLKAFGEQTLEKAHRYRRISFNELTALCCSLEGLPAPGIGADASAVIKAGFSTTSLPGILSNIGHKVMLQAYTDVPARADLLCRPLTASDFKTHTGYRLSGDMKFKELSPDGEITHGKLSESSYTYAVKTYGRMFGLTRAMQINDDLGAFAEVPRMIGRGAALMKEELFWTLVHANTGNFFHADNANLITKVLGSAGLDLAVKALEEQTDEHGDPILVMGKYLVVPPALKTMAKELYQSTNINTGGASTSAKVPNANIHAGEYEPQSSPYISNTSFHANASATQWYLWGNPADIAAFGIVYLNGVNAPTVEDVALSGEYLGNAWRGYMDVGVCQIDPRGAVKSTGTVA